MVLPSTPSRGWRCQVTKLSGHVGRGSAVLPNLASIALRNCDSAPACWEGRVPRITTCAVAGIRDGIVDLFTVMAGH